MTFGGIEAAGTVSGRWLFVVRCRVRPRCLVNDYAMRPPTVPAASIDGRPPPVSLFTLYQMGAVEERVTVKVWVYCWSPTFSVAV